MAIVLANGERYVTYFPRKFDIDDIYINLNNNYKNKPTSAFWGSPIDGKFCWKEWCEREGFEIDSYLWDKPIYWTLKEGTKILQIDTELIDQNTYELKKYCTTDSRLNSFTYKPKFLDFNRILKAGIGAVQLMNAFIGHRFVNEYDMMFNGWDCESIVVLDSSLIEFETK